MSGRFVPVLSERVCEYELTSCQLSRKPSPLSAVSVEVSLCVYLFVPMMLCVLLLCIDVLYGWLWM